MSSLRLAIKLSMAENKDSANPVPKAKSEDDAITEVILGRKRKHSADFKESTRKRVNKDRAVSVDAADAMYKQSSEDELEPDSQKVESAEFHLPDRDPEENRQTTDMETDYSPPIVEVEVTSSQNKEETDDEQLRNIASEEIEQDGGIPGSSITELIPNAQNVEENKEEYPVENLQVIEVVETDREVPAPVEKKEEDTEPIEPEERMILTARSEEIELTEEADEETGQVARYQSVRTAAKVAKTKFASNKPSKGGEPKGGRKSQHTEKASNTANAMTDVKTEWIQCDDCGKWRSIPPSAGIDINKLPDKWFCHMNSWDLGRSKCEAEEEPYQSTDYVEMEEGKTPTAVENITEPSSRRGKGKGKKTIANESIEAFTKIEEPPIVKEHQSGRKKGGSKAIGNRNPNISDGSSAIPVSWVQCNKCKKWRKAPNVDDLPEKWYCSLNTWNPNFASCSVRQEEDDTQAEPNLLVHQTPHRGGRRLTQQSGAAYAPATIDPPASNGPTSAAPVVKKTSWVQCERKGCKKWRKVPATIDIDSLPEKWYCEMNTWNLESASCDAPEDVDSDTEKNNNEPRNHFVLAGPSKGPSAISYRRIIFGNDGKIKACFSEKNRNGYGLFSYNVAPRNSYRDEDEYVEPLKKIGYWWSSLYSEPSSIVNEDSLDNNESLSLLNVFHRMSSEEKSLLQPRHSFPKKLDPAWKLLQTIPLLSRIKAESVVIRSCFLALNQPQVSLSVLIETIRNSQFLNPIVEACRAYFTPKHVLDSLRRLEEQDEVEVAFTSAGEMVILLLVPLRELQSSVASRSKVFAAKHNNSQMYSEKWAKAGVPLKMRKFFVPHANSQIENRQDSSEHTDRLENSSDNESVVNEEKETTEMRID